LDKLARQADLYDAIHEAMEDLFRTVNPLSIEELNQLSVACQNAADNRLALRRIIADNHNAAWTRESCTKVGGELHKICSAMLELLDQILIPKASNGESKVFYTRMKAEFCRYMAGAVQGVKY